jgi:signal transduction histidine kinase
MARRTGLAALLTAVVLIALLGSWFASGWSGVRAEQRAVRALPREQARVLAEEHAYALDRELAELADREGARPYFHYQSLFHDPRGAAEGNAVVPSPLSGGPDDPLVAAHFQIDAAGAVTLPTLNEQVPEVNQVDLADNRRLRDTIAASVGELRDDGVAVASVGRVEVLEQQAYVQNIQANEVYQSAKQMKKPALRAAPAGDVAITVAPLRWRTVEIGGAPALAALREVVTPDGTLTQGFLVELATVRERVAGADVVVATADDATPGAPLATAGGAWRVVVDDGPAIRAADARAAALVPSFLVRFIPIAVLATGCAVLVVFMVARAERTARQRAQFAAAAAHELRTPLAGLQLYGDMLADGLGNPDRAQDYARRVSEEAARLGRVVSNVLDFSRLERGNLTVTPRAGDAAPVVRAAVDRARPALERGGVALVADIPDALPARLDDDALARILGNLLDNADKYGRAGADRTITVTAARDGDKVTITVRDGGPGVRAGTQQAIFQPFTRGVTDDGPPGLGLGLSLSRSLARSMGGDLALRPGGPGATFVVTLAAT